jgi:hypothetical protein
MQSISPQLNADIVQPTVPAGRGFFAINAQAIPPICALGINSAVAYVVLATGTGKDQSQTFWGVHAIEKYTAISRHRARAALDLLKAQKHIEPIVVNGRPGHRLTPIAASDPTPRLFAWEQKIPERVRAGIPVSAGTAATRGQRHQRVG